MSLKKYIGNRAFYRHVLAIAVPIMVQNGITNFVNLLDNIMVGTTGTEPMSGVSIVNQFIFIFNLLIFGAIAAAGIFTAQYHGSGDVEGVRHTFRFKILICTAATLVCVVVFFFFADPLISLFLHDGSETGDLAATLMWGREYLIVMLIGLLPYALAQVYASTMRETGETVKPMIASLLAVITNFVFNSLLIFGLFGLPALGVKGAAIATVISRSVELLFLVLWGHTHTARFPFLIGVYRTFRIPGTLAAHIAAKGLPLMANELFWSLAVTLRNQCYSVRGLDVVAAQNISSTIYNVFSVVYLSLGTTISIIIGNQLGAGEIERAKDTEKKLVAFSVFCGVLTGMVLILLSPVYPMLYNTTDSVRALAAYMIIVVGCTMPIGAYANAAYFVIRSGGQVMVTILFDSAFMWAIIMPLAFSLSRFTDVSIYWLYAVCQGAEVLKVLFGAILLRRGTWARRLVAPGTSQE